MTITAILRSQLYALLLGPFVLSLPKSRRRRKQLFEQLESRALLSATLFVTDAATPVDATHFHTLQAALAAAVTGDTVHLQAGFSAGTFLSTTQTLNSAVGDTAIRTALALDVGDVITIDAGAKQERDLVTAVTATGSGDFSLTLATPLQFTHSGANINSGNAFSVGPIIGINKGITLTADANAGPLPFDVEIWQGTTGVTLSNLQFTGSGNSANAVMVDTGAHGNVLSNLTISGRLLLDTGSSATSVSGSNLHQVTINTGSHDNTLTGNTIAALTAAGTGDSNGHDLFQQNTFTGSVKITGNDTLATNDSLLNNTFTVASGNGLILLNADGTLLQGNTVTDSVDGANAVMVHNSDNVVITGNTFTTTGSQGTALFCIADGTGSTSVDINGNALHTTDGIGIFLEKFASTAALEVRVQGNDLTNNAAGVYIFGDGDSAGNIDLGGGSTRFGTGTGGNNFSSYTSTDGSHFAVGLFMTSDTYTLNAQANLWSVADPTTVVADSTHTPDASGSGIIVAAAAPQPSSETLTLSTNDLSTIQTGTTSGVVATLSSNLVHTASDFTATIDWGDGTASPATLVANGSGGFNVVAAHQWNSADTFTFTVSVTDVNGTLAADGTATVTPRLLVALGKNFTSQKKVPFSGVVATFTDNLGATLASGYVATVKWSDGTTSPATIVQNSDGSFGVSSSRSFNSSGGVFASIKVSTTSGAFTTTASANGTITDSGIHGHGPCRKICHKVVTVCFKRHDFDPRAFLKSLCHR